MLQANMSYRRRYNPDLTIPYRCMRDGVGAKRVKMMDMSLIWKEGREQSMHQLENETLAGGGGKTEPKGILAPPMRTAT